MINVSPTNDIEVGKSCSMYSTFSFYSVSVSFFIELLINPKYNSKQITIQLNTLHYKTIKLTKGYSTKLKKGKRDHYMNVFRIY